MIELKVNEPIEVGQFRDILVRSTLAERRPVDDPQCLEGMLKNANLTVTAWDDEKLVGIARSVTDFSYCCYLSDLAVDTEYQRRGIGKRLISETQSRIGMKCKLILIAAPAAKDYYGHIGFTHNDRCWILAKDEIKR